MRLLFSSAIIFVSSFTAFSQTTPPVREFAERSGGKTVDGILIKEGDTVQFKPLNRSDQTFPIEAINGEPLQTEGQTAPAVSTIPVRAKVTVSDSGDALSLVGRSVTADTWDAGKPDRRFHLRGEPELEQIITELSTVVKAYNAAWAKALTAPEDSEEARNVENLRISIKNLTGQFLLLSSSEQTGDMNPLVTAHVGELLYGVDFVDKAAYPGAGNFSPQVYGHIASCSGAIAKVVPPSGDTGTGFLVGDHLLITCAHVVRNARDSEITIQFFPENGPLVEYGVTTIRPEAGTRPDRFVGTRPAGWPTSLDFVLLKLVPRQVGSGGSAGDYLTERQIIPIALSTRRVLEGEPLFGIGFPASPTTNSTHSVGNGGITVHDSFEVELPYEVLGEQFNVFIGNIAQKVARTFVPKVRIRENATVYDDAFLENSRIQEQYLKDLKRELEAIRQLYAHPATFENALYCWRPSADRGDFRPSFGFGSNTFGGDSGAAIFSKKHRSRSAIGLFYGGAGDSPRARPLTPQLHESAIPASEIVAHLRRYHPGLITHYHITINAE